MTGSGAPLTDIEGGPVIILVRPQLGENIGTAARAMMNCGLTEMRLVSPRDDWPNPKAVAAASGADAIVEAARVYDSVTAATQDLNRVYATTARRRDMFKEVLPPRAAVYELIAAELAGERTGLLFGPEAKGLNNDEVTLASKIVEAPLNPHHGSLNLAQAVLLMGWEWRMQRLDDTPLLAPGARETAMRDGAFADAMPAPQRDLVNLFEHLERELDDAGFFFPAEKGPTMARNIRNMLHRAHLTEQEVRTLRGVVKALSEKRKRG
jgi:tRNA/rRNA methyltransferase